MRRSTLTGQKITEAFLKEENGKLVTNAECGPTPPGEIVIRSAFCNLRCIPCFAYNYSWPEKAKENKEVISVPLERLLGEFLKFINSSQIPGNRSSYNWFRIVGGEPFLNKLSLEYYVNFLLNIPDNISPKFNSSILIQTNGIILGTIDKDELVSIFSPLKDKPFKIVIEISIKGSNLEEFMIITQTQENSAKKFFDAHLQACENMQHVHTYIPNIDWTAVAGFGIGVTNLISGNFSRKEYIKTFYHPIINKPFYHPECWDNRFRSIYNLHIEKYRSKFGDKFPMFGIEDRFRWKFALRGLKNCREICEEKYGCRYFYDGYQIYVKGIKESNVELEQNLDEILKRFFFGDPSYYYMRLFR